MGITFKRVTSIIKKVWDGLTKVLAPAFETAFAAVGVVIDTALKTIMGVIDVFIALFKGDWKGLFAALKRIFSAQWNGLKALAGTLFNGLFKMWDAVLGWFGTSWKEIWNGIKSFFEGIWTGITGAASTGLNSVKSTVGGALTAISNTFTWRCADRSLHNILRRMERDERSCRCRLEHHQKRGDGWHHADQRSFEYRL